MNTPTFFCKVARNEDGSPKYTDFIDGISSPIWIHPTTGEEINVYKVPGAIHDAHEINGSFANRVKEDGRVLYVTLPTLESWCIDGPSNNGPGWKRTGEPGTSNFSVTPSILTPKYHGYLTNGVLIPC